MIIGIMLCEMCGEETKRKSQRQKYCKVCAEKRKLMRKNEKVERICKKCKQKFITTQQRYVCLRCYNEKYSKTNREVARFVETSCGDCLYCYANKCDKIRTSGKEYYRGSKIYKERVIYCPRFKKDTRQKVGDKR